MVCFDGENSKIHDLRHVLLGLLKVTDNELRWSSLALNFMTLATDYNDYFSATKLFKELQIGTRRIFMSILLAMKWFVDT